MNTSSFSFLLRRAIGCLTTFALVLSSFAAFAVPAAQAADPNWDTSGAYVLNFNYNGADYAHSVSLTQGGSGELSGNGSSGAYAWVIDSGSVSGNDINFTAHYTAASDAVAPLTVMSVVGTIAGGSMSGTWTDNYQGGSRQGTWATASGSAEPEPAPIKVHIFKYLLSDGIASQIPNDSGAPDFPMIAQYSIAGLATNLDPGDSYALGNGGGAGGSDDGLLFAANTVDLAGGDIYGTHEVTGGDSPVVASEEQCAEGKYVLKGYKVGDSLEQAQAAEISLVAPSFNPITASKYVIVVNEACAPNEEAPTEEPAEPAAMTVTVTGDTAAGENQPGWLFNRDSDTQTPYEFKAGNQDIGTGSLYVPPIANTVNGNSDKFIGELFLKAPLSTINSISYRFNIGSTTIADAGQFYMSVYATFGESATDKFYDCRYNVVPSTGIVGGYATVTFDPTVATYAVTTRGGAAPSPHACPASPAGMDALDAGSPSIRAISLNVGDTSGSDLGVAGYLDTIVVHTDSMVTTYDFEPATETFAETPDETATTAQNRRNGSGGGRLIGGAPAAGSGEVEGASTGPSEVLGAETGPECADAPLIASFMRMGADNDLEQVKLLQAFLTGEMGTANPVTGLFDAQTDTAVKAFQLKYADEILAPWGISEPTGWVYQLTQWKINSIACPTLGVSKPSVQPFEQGVMGDSAASDAAIASVAGSVVLPDTHTGENAATSTASQTAAAANASSTPGWFGKFIHWLFGK